MYQEINVGTLVIFKNSFDGTLYEVAEITYDREGNKMIDGLLDPQSQELVDEDCYYPESFVIAE